MTPVHSSAIPVEIALKENLHSCFAEHSNRSDDKFHCYVLGALRTFNQNDRKIRKSCFPSSDNLVANEMPLGEYCSCDELVFIRQMIN